MDSVSGREDLQRYCRELTRKGVAAELAKTTEGIHLATSCVQDHRGWLVERQDWLASMWLTPGKSISKHRSSWGSSGDILRSEGQGLWGKTAIVFLPTPAPSQKHHKDSPIKRQLSWNGSASLENDMAVLLKKKLSCVINYHMIQKFCLWVHTHTHTPKN